MAKRRQALGKPRAVRRPAKPNVDLNQEIAALKRELAQERERRAATTDVLRAVSRSTFDLQAVLHTLIESAVRLCEADKGTITRQRGSVFYRAETYGFSREFADYVKDIPIKPERGSVNGRTLLEGTVVHIADVQADPAYSFEEAQRLGDFRTLLGVPLLREGEVIGVIALGRERVKAFTDEQIELATSFADQAVIAIENSRLLTELRESLDRQTATSEVLGVISSSPSELQPVFEKLLECALKLCNAHMGTINRMVDGAFTEGAKVGAPPEFADFVMVGFRPPPYSPLGQMVATKSTIQVRDYAETQAYREGLPATVALVELGRARSALQVPLLREREVVGALTIYRPEVRPFENKEVALVENFAKQAVIAIENARLITETREALEQQTATAQVLQVINSSPGDLAPVFDAMLEKAMRLLEATFGGLWIFDGDRYVAAALRGVPTAYAEHLRGATLVPGPGTAPYRFLHGERAAIQNLDLAAEEPYRAGDPQRRALVDLGGARTALQVPLIKDDTILGLITIYRQEVRPFSDKQIALLQNFAAQAVIAMENARLITQTREALEQQTATAEVLQVINSSPGDLAPVFDAMLEKATLVCSADAGVLCTYDGERFWPVAIRGFHEFPRDPIRPHPQMGIGRVARGEDIVHILDSAAGEVYESGHPGRQAIVKLGGARSQLCAALRKEGKLLGSFTIWRREVRAFTEKEITLLQNFAAQAVIAMENARLLGELRQRTTELARSVDELTATGDVLKIISRSSVELETVLDTLVETVARLCRADQAYMFRRQGEQNHLLASHGISAEVREFILTHPLPSDRSTISGRVALEHRPVHVADVLEDAQYGYSEGRSLTGARTHLGIPLLREETLVGIFIVARTCVEPFTDKEIELATSFADQAVIAIENARLFDELRERQAELRVTFDNMGDGVVMFDAEARLTAWNRNFQDMLQLPESFLAARPSFAEYFRYLAQRGEYASADLEEQLSRSLDDTRREMRFERTRPDGHIIEVRRNPVPDGGFVMIYADITERKRAEEAIRSARDVAEAALRELQTAQASLVHAQKMAALGQLTAGIAHEIKNPLNFVNNFAGLSVELLEELKQASAQAMGALDVDKRAEITETIQMLTGNLEKIAEHGRRADGIVKSMLQHSRGGSGDWQASDLNALVEEALNLAYHGARAQDQSFNITMERELDRNLAPIDIVPQDMMRVFLNLIGNGFYAAGKRRREADGAYRPVLKVATHEVGDAVEIRVRDNGVGISSEHREKLFQPFFTTKPTGEGTGLGLSISYDIVTQQHGGTIRVESEVGQFTEFTVRLPRRQHPAAGRWHERQHPGR